MKFYLGDWKEQENEFKKIYKDGKIIKYEFYEDLDKYKLEIERFQKGLDLIKSDPDILYSFKLTNLTFLEKWETPYKTQS